MEADLGYVHCASEERANKFFKFKFGDLHGRLEVWPKALKVDGKKGSRTFPNCQSVDALYVRPPILGTVFVVLAVVGFGSLFSGGNPEMEHRDDAFAQGYRTGQLIGTIIGLALTFLAVRFLLVFRWVRVRYVDPDGTPGVVCFSQSNVMRGTYSHLPFGFKRFLQRIDDAVEVLKSVPSTRGRGQIG